MRNLAGFLEQFTAEEDSPVSHFETFESNAREFLLKQIADTWAVQTAMIKNTIEKFFYLLHVYQQMGIVKSTI